MAKPDEEVKLILDAFQMSVSACAALPGTRLLRAQMQGRLMQVDSDAVKVGCCAASDVLAVPQGADCRHPQQLHS